MDFETIRVNKGAHIATLALNRPEVMNAVNFKMFEELKTALREINDDKDIRVMVLTGTGKAFCASFDIKEGGAAVGQRLLPQWNVEQVRQFLRHSPQRVTLGIRNMEKPTIAMINGLAVADGVDWALACDIRIGSENARFMSGFARVGAFPNTGATWLYPRAMGVSKALEFLYSSDWMSAEEACRTGILNRVVPAAKLEEATMELAHKIARGAPASLRMIKLQTYKGLDMSLENALELAADGEAMSLFTRDHIEAISAFLQKREPNFTDE